MGDASSPRVKRLYLASLAILLLGLGLSVALYLRAVEARDAAMVEEFRNSKVYRHDLELYGGKMSMLGDQLSRWFEGLWQGRQLAITIGCISAVTALGLFAMARLLGSDVHDQPQEVIRDDQGE